MRTRIGSVGLRRWTLALMATAAIVAGDGAASAATIAETVQRALDTNPEVGIVQNNRRAVDQELRQARAGYLPSLDFRGAAGPEWSDNFTTRSFEGGSETKLRSEADLTLSQMLFDGFETKSEVDRQRARVDSAAYRVEEAAEFVGLNAIEAHLDVLRNQEIVRLNEANIAQHERILGQVRDLEENGRGDIADVRQTEARLARAFDTLATSRGSLADAIAAYQRVVGIRPGDLEDTEAPVAGLPPSPEDAANLASVSSPTVRIAAADVDVAAAETRASRSGFYPRFDLQVGAGLNHDIDGADGRDNDARALLVMRYNLYRGGADMALEREAFHRMNEARVTLENTRRDAEQEARISYNALDTARARIEASVAKVEAQRRTRDAYASQFEIGQRQLLDVLDSENELFLDRVSLTTALYTERFAVYRVLAVVGELLDTLEIARPRETISINRTPADQQTPEAIGRKSVPILDPRSEPRPVRGRERGEPPFDALDMAPLIDGTETPSGAEAALPPEPDSRAVAMADTSVAGIVADLADGRTVQIEPTAALAEEPRTTARDLATPASYESFGAFVDSVLGGPRSAN